MSKEIEKRLLIATVFFSIVAIVFMLYLKIEVSPRKVEIAVKEETSEEKTMLEGKYIPYISGESEQRELLIALPEASSERNITVTRNDLQKLIAFSVDGMTEAFLQENGISGDCSFITQMYYDKTKEGVALFFETDHVYAYEMRKEEGVLHIQFMKPSDKSNKIVLLAPAYGGGTSENAKKYEFAQEITLDIAKKVQALAEDETIDVYLTRNADVSVSDEQVLALGKEIDADVIVGLEVGVSEDTTEYGIKTLYNGTFFIPEFGSGDLAYNIEEELQKKVPTKALGIEAYEEKSELLQKATLPVSIVRLGYVSNEKEFSNLNLEAYKQELAEGLFQGIVAAFAQKETGE